MKDFIEFPVEVLREILDYNEFTGELTWKARGEVSPYWTPRGARCFNNQFAGKEAGFDKKVVNRDYTRREMKLPGGKNYTCHRVIWAWKTGKWPTSLIDHIDQNPLNNAWNNLRESDFSGNQQNVRLRSDNSSGLVGVSFDCKRNQWKADIMCRGKREFLITSDFFEACCFRKSRERKYDFHQNHGKRK